MSGILQKILAAKLREVEHQSRIKPLAVLRDELQNIPPPRKFINAIETAIAAGRAAVIAEMKKVSPSRGALCENETYCPADFARDYETAGAACLSVLTDEKFFGGHAEHLCEAKNACALPVLRKDFIIDAYQIFESRAIGADAILLIAAALDDATLRNFAAIAAEHDLDVLVEAHTRDELLRALQTPCKLIGINNRDLRNFNTRLETTLDLLQDIPAGRIVVTESGLHSREDVQRMRENNVHTFLVGEALMRAANPGEKLREMFA